MKVTWEGCWAGKDSECLSDYIYDTLRMQGYYDGEIEALRGQVDKLQEIVTRLVEHAVVHAREPTSILKKLLEEEGLHYSVEENDA